jgi:prepilin-type N-terminal cleavage/methylation domain-containing protein
MVIAAGSTGSPAVTEIWGGGGPEDDAMRRRLVSLLERGAVGARPRSGQDEGLTLIEILIAVVLLGIAGVALMSTWSTGINVSGRNRDVADAEAVLASAAERVSGFDPWIPCGQPDVQRYQDAARTAPLPSSPGWSASAISVSAIKYWNGLSTGDVFGPTCSDGYPVRQITVTVQSPRGALERMQVVTSNA